MSEEENKPHSQLVPDEKRLANLELMVLKLSEKSDEANENIENLKDFVSFNELTSSPNDWNKILEGFYEEARKHSKEFLSIQDKAKENVNVMERYLKEQLEVWETAVKEKIALDETSNAWEQMEGSHTTGAYVWAAAFLSAVIAVALFIYFEAIPRADQILARPNGQELSYGESILRLIAHAVPSAAAVGFVIWGLRILVRMFFRERALAEDAADRKAMIKTLAGLALDKGFDSRQRIIVMQALFRSRTEAAVNDGSPMEAIQAIASSSLKKG